MAASRTEKGVAMRIALRWWVGLLVAIGVAAVWLLWSGDRAAPSGSKITISRETTFITEPLTEDGYVDYLAALNAISSKGVTPQNNAAVLLHQAFGPKDVPRERRDHVAGLLGIKPLPDDGKYFVESFSFLRQDRKEATTPPVDSSQDSVQAGMAQFEKAWNRPWSKDEFPLVAARLGENEQPLELIVTASKRPRFYFPLFGSGERPMVIEALLPLAQQAREAARALVTRAMFRLKAGKIDQAWQDVLACHRLGRLVGQGPTIVEGLVGFAIDGIACQADAATAHYGQLSAEQAGRFADDLRQLPPMAKMAEKIDTGERFLYLDAVSMMARRGPAEIGRLAGGTAGKNGWGASLANLAANATINWDEPMRIGNAWYDRFAEAFAKPTRAERDAALKQIEDDVKETARKTKDIKFLLGEFLSNSPRRTVGRQIGRILVALLVPAISAVAKAEDRAAAHSSMGQVALALAAYRAEHGAYPTQLVQLSPKYLAAVPEDPLAKGPLRYKRTESGWVVYSIGPNGKDDGGASRSFSPADDASVPVDADDVAIAMPQPGK